MNMNMNSGRRLFRMLNDFLVNTSNYVWGNSVKVETETKTNTVTSNNNHNVNINSSNFLPSSSVERVSDIGNHLPVFGRLDTLYQRRSTTQRTTTTTTTIVPTTTTTTGTPTTISSSFAQPVSAVEAVAQRLLRGEITASQVYSSIFPKTCEKLSESCFFRCRPP